MSTAERLVKVDLGFGYASDCNWSIFSEKEIDLINRLPHGSGIDCPWYGEKLKNGKLVLSNAYHVMNDAGFYIGYADFSITIDLANIESFRLQFHGRHAQYLCQYYGLRDYLEDTILSFPHMVKRAI